VSERKGRKPGPKGSRLSTEIRRTEAIKLRVAGWNTYAIAEKLDVTHQTVSEYIETYLDRVKEESKDRISHERELDILRIEESLIDVEACIRALRVDAKQGEREASQTIARLLDTRCKLIDRRAKLLGTDAPAKSEVTGKDGSPLVEEVTPQRIRDVMRARFGGNVCPEVEEETNGDGNVPDAG
jgi:predicted transcriptional regulator